jgi:predicted unusual protein kinase regulating ubiquinone biosynthesis (AarF/ABC1/UbiB family)
MRRRLAILASVAAVVAGIVAIFRRTGLHRPLARSLLRPTPPAGPINRTTRAGRNLELARLGVAVGGTYAATGARKLFASAERRAVLDDAARLRTAEQVSERLGNMKGALMKVGQMASYLDDGLPEPVRQALSALQAAAPPMSADLAAEVVERELGKPPDALFVEWDPEPIAAASIGQVHRAVALDPASGDELAVAVKVQYPGVGEAIESDLANTEFLGALLKQGFSGLDPADMVSEIKERVSEELDYVHEAVNQQNFAAFYRGHPFIHVPAVVPSLSTARVLTSELVVGAPWREALGWDQHQRDLAGEALFRFVFRSLYRMRAFNGDPHPGNYLFHGDGRITFLDFGLVRYFSAAELAVFASMVKAAAVDHDAAAFRQIVEGAGLLRPGAPVPTDEAGAYFSQFYEPVAEDRTTTWTPEYSSSIVRHTFDRSSPIAQYATVPRAFVFIQRINLGLYALLGDLRASGNYRRMAEELWPFADGPPSTPLGEEEARWLIAQRE